MNKSCRKCSALLILGVNCKPSAEKKRDYICYTCRKPIKSKEVLSIKHETIEKYGGKCTCCSETILEFLTIDHVDETGAVERKEIGRSGGYNFYYWLKKQGYPKDNYQVLCFNCNFAKHAYGKCPHQPDNLKSVE